MYYVLCVIVGIVAEKLICNFLTNKGTLKIDLSEEDRENYSFVVKDLDDLVKYRYVKFKVEITRKKHSL